MSSFLGQRLWAVVGQLVLIRCRPAHCFHYSLPSFPLRTLYALFYTVWLGSTDVNYSSKGKEYYVSRIVIYPKRDGLLDGDIALLRLSSQVTFTDVILPICLPNASKQHTLPASCWVTGWGQNKEGMGETGGERD